MILMIYKFRFFTIRAQAYMSLFIVAHNLPILTADHLSELMPVMIPMCHTAKKMNFEELYL